MKFFLRLAICFSMAFLMACGGDQPRKATKQSTRKASVAPKPKRTTAVPKANNTEEEEEAMPQSDPLPPEQIEKAEEIIAGADASAIAAVDAKKMFKTYCAACHGFTGNLNVNGAKDLTASKISLTERVAQIYHGKGLMTPFRGLMKDEEIIAVAKYIETLRK
ncbi:MAG: cytochrome c [Bacteroidota bacterium]